MLLPIDSLPDDIILHYLGHDGQAVSPELGALIDRCKQLTLRTATPRVVYKRYAIVQTTSGLELEQARLVLPGNSIRKHLTHCTQAFVFAVTVGAQLDRVIRSKMLTNPDEGVIINSCASAAVEALADAMCERLAQSIQQENLYLTRRYSPGYGDFPLEIQQPLLFALDAFRKVGLSCTQSCLLTPTKSITAVVGITREGVKPDYDSCDDCKARHNCTIRRQGKAPCVRF